MSAAVFTSGLSSSGPFARAFSSSSLRYEDAPWSPELLHQMLKEADPASAEAIHPNNVKRVIRALEYFHLTGFKKRTGMTPTQYRRQAGKKSAEAHL